MSTGNVDDDDDDDAGSEGNELDDDDDTGNGNELDDDVTSDESDVIGKGSDAVNQFNGKTDDDVGGMD